MGSDNGQWEPPTNSDDGAQLDSDDHPTLAATAEQIEAGRAASRVDATAVKRTTPPGLSAAMPREPGPNEDAVDTSNFERVENTHQDFDPKITARGLQIKERAPANRSGSMAPVAANGSGSITATPDVSDGRVVSTSDRRSGPATLSGLDSRGVRAPATRPASEPGASDSGPHDRKRNHTAAGASGSMRPPADRSGPISAKSIAAATTTPDDDFDPASTARGMPAVGRTPGPPGADVVLLDRVTAPVTEEPRRTDAAAGGIVVVATGSDGERVRKLCHTHSLLVPVMSSLSIAHEAMSVVVIGEPSPPAPDRVVHVVRPTVPDAQLIELLRALSSGRVLVERPPQPTSPDQRVREFAQRVARMSDRASIETTMIEALTVLVDADRAYCWFFDASSGTLWSEGHRLALGDNRRAMGGLVGWAAYTGQRIHASPPEDDARFLLELDDPDGKPQSRIIVQPIVGGDRRVHAVLVAVRRWRNAAFEDAQLRLVADLAALCGPALDIIASTGPRGPKFRPANTLPGPLAAATSASSGGTTAARDSAVVDARSKRPSSRPPPVTTAAVHPLTATLKNMEAARSGQSSQKMEAARSDSQSIDAARPPHIPTKPPPLPVPPRITAATPAIAIPATPPSAVTATPSSGAPVAAPTANGTASDSRRLRASTAQPPSTSNTGRTRPITGGERVSGAMRARPYQQVAVVGGDDVHDRVQRIANACGIDVAVASSVEEAPADARIITIGRPWSPSIDPRVVYVARDAISNDALTDLISAMSSGRALGAAAPLTKPSNPNDARRAQQAFTGSRTFAAAASLTAAETSAIATMRELLDADRAYFLYYDDADGSLKSAARGHDERRAIAGIAGWVARTGRAASAERATADPRWLGPIDDPDGDPNSQLIVEPVIVGDRVRAVLVAARRPRRPGFVEADVQLLARFAALVAPLVDQLLLHADNAPAPAPAPVAARRTKRATEQAVDDLRGVLPIWQRLPMWSYAAGGAVVLLLIALIASC